MKPFRHNTAEWYGMEGIAAEFAGLTPFPSRGWCVELVEFMETRFFSRRFTYVIRLRGELVGLLAASL